MVKLTAVQQNIVNTMKRENAFIVKSNYYHGLHLVRHFEGRRYDTEKDHISYFTRPTFECLLRAEVIEHNPNTIHGSLVYTLKQK